jgi:hypothetical protein
MKRYSQIQRRSFATPDRLVAKIQPRSVDEPAIDQAQPPRYDFSHVDLFAHAPQDRPLARLQLKSAPDSASSPALDLDTQLNSSKNSGSPLPTEVRSFMEPRFGADFSQVRVHTGSDAIQMNQDLSAQAFTHGQDVFFGAGKSPANDALTAHELTHVVQQQGTTAPGVQAQGLGTLDNLVQCKKGEKGEKDRKRRKGEKSKNKRSLRRDIQEDYDNWLEGELDAQDELDEQDELEETDEVYDGWAEDEQDELDEQEIESDNKSKEKEEQLEKEKAEQEKLEKEKAEQEKLEKVKGKLLEKLKTIYESDPKLQQATQLSEAASNIAKNQYEITEAELIKLFSSPQNIDTAINQGVDLVNGFVATVLEKIAIEKIEKEKAEKEKEEKLEAEWQMLSSQEYGKQASKLAAEEYKQKEQEISQALANKRDQEPKGSKERREWKKKETKNFEELKQQLKTAQEGSQNLETVENQASQEWKVDLQALRSAGLSRETIDAIVTHFGFSKVHELIQNIGAAALALLVQHLTLSQVENVLAAGCPVSNKLTAQVLQVFRLLLDNGGSGKLVVQGWKSLGDELIPLINSPVACVKLLSMGNLSKLKGMIQGGHSELLANLVPVIDAKWVDFLLTHVTDLKDFSTLCAQPKSLFSLLTAGVPMGSLQLWCKDPILPSTILLLSHPDLPDCLPMLPTLAQFNLSPTDLMATLSQGASATVVASGVAKAKDLLQTPQQVLNYFALHPTHSLQTYSQTVALAAAQKASLPPTNMGEKTAESGKKYTDWDHHAELDNNTLEMLLREGYARIKYIGTFETQTEQTNGGDTEEYEIETWDGTAWPCLWVVHIHRKKGNSKKDNPIASHMKREKQKKLKDAKRIPISTALAAKCREKNSN